ncbi:MAG: S41 family peptidase [Flexistipes sinusarabici]|uniref:S41 family peptidase n=1 Tax=Flexistipes sinusarabici TaxID=2352 RepID=A0A5D0MN00_FLESI|nr:S41 family peptidase [Flexistipes sinusarabici]TYB33772.1 MAG: S41 family peptidase [Flexistipes sinusarabici]
MNNKKKLIPILFAFVIITASVFATFTVKITDVYAAKEESRYQNLETLTDAINIIEKNYVEDVKMETLIQGAVKGMLSELDPHSSYLTPEMFKEFKVETKGEFGGLGITISIKDNILTIISPIEDTPADKAGLQAGDKIIKIEGKPTTNITLEEAVDKLRGKPGTKVTITIFREGKDKPFDVTITRDIIKIKAVKSKVIDNLGYIRLTQFKQEASKETSKALKKLEEQNVEGLILDLRNNPGGLLSEAVRVSSIFLPEDKTVVYTKDRDGTEKHLKTRDTEANEEKLPMVVLINEGSASASEIVSGALQDYKRALVIGQTSFGKASVQTIIPMGNDSAIKITTARYYTPNGQSIQNVGIKPDIMVKQGTVNYEDGHPILKESDLQNHLPSEISNSLDNSSDNTTTTDNKTLENDLQLKFAVDMLKGLVIYGQEKTAK